MSWSWIVTVAVVAIIGLFLSGGVTMLIALLSKLGKVLADAAGAADAAINLLQDQLQTCKDNGPFNVGKGCLLGIGFLLYFSSQILAIVGKATGALKWIYDKTSKSINKAARAAKDKAVELGADPKDVTKTMDERIKKAAEIMEKAGFTEGTPEYKVATKLAATKGALKSFQDQVDTIENVEQKKIAQKALDEQVTTFEESKTNDIKDFDDDGKKAVEEAVEGK